MRASPRQRANKIYQLNTTTHDFLRVLYLQSSLYEDAVITVKENNDSVFRCKQSFRQRLDDAEVQPCKQRKFLLKRSARCRKKGLQVYFSVHYLKRKELHSGNLARFMFKVVHFAGVSLLDSFLPLPW